MSRGATEVPAPDQQAPNDGKGSHDTSDNLPTARFLLSAKLNDLPELLNMVCIGKGC